MKKYAFGADIGGTTVKLGLFTTEGELLEKWEAWLRMGCMASEMESAALFIVGAYRRVRVGSVFLAIANQEREKLGLENRQVHDTDGAVRTAVEAVREMIRMEKSS